MGNIISICRAGIAILCFGFACSQNVTGATLASYPFSSGVGSTDADANSTAGDITSGDESNLPLSTDGGDGNPAPSLGNNMTMTTVGDDLADVISQDHYYSFILTPDSGKGATYSELQFDYWKSGGGAAIGAAVFAGVPAFDAVEGEELASFSDSTSGTWFSKMVDLSSLAASNAAPVEFRLYIWSAGTFGGNQLRVDNLTLLGNTADVDASDTTPPGPNPMQFNISPITLSGKTVVMTAVTATETQSTPVEYIFTNTSNGDLFGWTTGTGWTNSELTANQIYSYQVKARDAVSNETAWSTAISVTSINYLVSYQFDGGSFASIDTEANSTASAISNGLGVPLGTSSDDGGVPFAPALALTYAPLANDLAAVIAADDYYTFTLTPESGVSVTYDSLAFSAFNSGGQAVDMWLLTDIDGFAVGDVLATASAPSASDWARYTMDISSLDTGVAIPVEFRLYLTDNGASSGGHRIRLDNIQMVGTTFAQTGSVFRFK